MKLLKIITVELEVTGKYLRKFGNKIGKLIID